MFFRRSQASIRKLKETNTTTQNYNPLLEADGNPATDPDSEQTTCSYYDARNRLQ